MRRVLCALLVVLCIAFVVRCACCGCGSSLGAQDDSVMLVRHHREIPRYPIAMYHSGFDDTNLSIMMDATDMWREVSDGKVDIRLQRWDPPEPFSHGRYARPFDGRYTAWYLHRDEPGLVPVLNRTLPTAAGLCIGRYVVILHQPCRSAETTFAVAAHELGHLAGLEHTRHDIKALMNPFAGNWSEYDSWQVCQLYGVCKRRSGWIMR